MVRPSSSRIAAWPATAPDSRLVPRLVPASSWVSREDRLLTIASAVVRRRPVAAPSSRRAQIGVGCRPLVGSLPSMSQTSAKPMGSVIRSRPCPACHLVRCPQRSFGKGPVDRRRQHDEHGRNDLAGGHARFPCHRPLTLRRCRVGVNAIALETSLAPAASVADNGAGIKL